MNKPLSSALHELDKQRNKTVHPIPSSIQKSVLSSTKATHAEPDDDDIDGVPLYDVRWNKKEEKPKEDPVKTKFKKSSWNSVDVNNEEVIVSTNYGGVQTFEKQKRSSVA